MHTARTGTHTACTLRAQACTVDTACTTLRVCVQARKLFDVAQKKAVKAIEDHCYAGFLASEHFSYILELKAKEGIVPGLPDFRLQRVLGQGGFGQV